MTPNPGGVESFLMNYYKKINKDKIHFDFLCNTHEKISFEDEIKELGGKIFKISMRSKHPLSQGLTIGWSDGNTFLPVNFALMSTKKKKNMIGSQPVTTDQRSIAGRRRAQAQRPMNILLQWN